MHVLLTGGTGSIGSAVLRHLLSAGHEVTALVRSAGSADAVAAAGAKPLEGDLTDTAWLTEQLRGVEGSVHTASPGDASSAEVDTSVATAVAAAFAGTGKPHVHTGGIWVWGSGHVTEDDPLDAPRLTAWRAGVEAIATGTPGARVSVVNPAIVYGDGRGIIAGTVLGAPRDEQGRLQLVGSGEQHWTTVHVEDLADLYVRVLESSPHGRAWIGASGQSPTVRELGEAAARGTGAPGVVPSSDADTAERLGELFAEALLLDQRATGARAKDELGWAPSHPSAVELLERGES